MRFDFIHDKVDKAHSGDQVFECIQGFAEQIGYPYTSYCIRLPLPLSRQNMVWYSNYPSSPERERDAQQETASWGDIATEVILHQRAREAGIRIDWVKTIHSANGTHGVLTMGRDIASALDAMTSDRYYVADLLLEAAHARITTLLFGKLVPEASVKMSPRELEVLKWIGEGKTSHEIASILGLSAATVNFHIKRLVEKMRSVNRTHAAVKAVALGFLSGVGHTASEASL